MNPNTGNVSAKDTEPDQQDKTQMARLSVGSFDSANAVERMSIKGIIKTDPEIENGELTRSQSKSKIVSFSSYDNCFHRGSIPSKSVQVNLDDDSIPDKAIIERRYSKTEEAKNPQEPTQVAVQQPAEETKSVGNAVATVQAPPDGQADNKKGDENAAVSKMAPENLTGNKKADANLRLASEDLPGGINAVEQPTEDIAERTAQETSVKEPKHNLGFTPLPEEKLDYNQDAKICEIIESIRPDQNIPRQYVIMEYIEQFYMDDDEDPAVKALFESHHNAPNLATFDPKTCQKERQGTIPVSESVIKVYEEVRKDDNVEVIQEIKSVEFKKLNDIEIGYEYNGPSTSTSDKTKLFTLCTCMPNDLNPGKPSNQSKSLVKKNAINTNKRTKQAIKTIKSTKVHKGPEKRKGSINRANPKPSKSRLPTTATRKIGKKTN